MIQIANAPCSWGALEFDGMRSQPIGYAQMLDELVETGYAGTELGDWGFMPTDPEALRAEMAQRDLTMLGAFVPVALRDASAHAAGVEHALKVARLLAGANPAERRLSPAEGRPSRAENYPFIVLADANATMPERTEYAGRVSEELGLSESDWRTFCAGAERVARAVRDETGLRTVFHHHCAGYVETPSEIARLLDGTDPELVGLALDTGHFAYGAGPAGCKQLVEALDRLGNRIWHVHFKDLDAHVAERARRTGWNYFTALRHGVFCELGRGCVDFRAVLDWLKEHEYEGWIVVEQDVLPGMGIPRESAERNRQFLRSLGV